MAHVAKNFEYLIGNIKGLSEKQLKNHFELYRGYVKKINEIEDKLTVANPESANYSFAEISELHRRRGLAFNGAYLHQIYFENLTGNATKPSGDLKSAIEDSYGTLAKWEDDVLAGLKTANGWVLLARSSITGKVTNNVIEEHHSGVMIGQDILLAIDGWEHAFMIDYGVKEADYFRAIMPVLDWTVASNRFETARRHYELVA